MTTSHASKNRKQPLVWVAALTFLHSGFAWAQANSDAGKGMAFDDTTPLYEASVNPENEITLQAWIKIDDQCPIGAILIDKLLPSGRSAYRLETAEGGVVQWVNSAGQSCQIFGPFAPNRWTYLTAVLSRSRRIQKFYIGGREIANLRNVSPQCLDQTAGPLRLGGNLAGEHRFIGAIERVTIFNRALTSDEIAASASDKALSTKSQPPKDSLADWMLPTAPGLPVASSGGGPPLTRAALLTSVTSGPDIANPALSLWFQQPAWGPAQALPVGNESMGALVFGDVQQERLQLLGASPRSGSSKSQPPESEDGALTAQDELQKSLKELSARAVGDLLLDLPEPGKVTQYCRSLDLDTGIARTHYKDGNITYTREVFSTVPSQVIVTRCTADFPRKINVTVKLAAPGASLASDSGLLNLSGTCEAGQFSACLLVKNDGGSVSIDSNGATVRDADAVTFLVSVATGSGADELAAKTSKAVQLAAKKNYEELRADHIADYQRLFRHITLEMGPGNGGCTDERLRTSKETNDPQLASLLFQFGRYLAISSGDRSGAQPADTRFAATSRIANLLLRSERGEIALLPALPKAWTAGRVKGLRAQDGVEIDERWENNRLTGATVRSITGAACTVRYGEKTVNLTLKPSSTTALDENLNQK